MTSISLDQESPWCWRGPEVMLADKNYQPGVAWGQTRDGGCHMCLPLLTCGLFCLKLGLCLCDLSLKTERNNKAKYIPCRTQNNDLNQIGSLKIMNGSGGGGGRNWEIEIDIYTLLMPCIKQMAFQRCCGQEPACQCRKHKRHGFDPWVGKIPWRRAW